ncbi:glycosyltransferase family 39 protein [Amycolatopsis sp. cg5]|uniref:glycosyltransferase family 39 protein n=1 Tax=Amycolatopsis sp. cg5 TaxID=3238802 RepID=UPI0035258857
MPATTAIPDTSVEAVTGVPRFHWRAALGVSVALTAGLLVVAGRYGYYMDELYFRVAGRNLDWGYIDQPPLVPLLSRIQTFLFGDTLFAIRVIPALLTGLSVFVAALIARELGGGGRAQVLAAVAASASLATMAAGHVLHPTAVDHVVWVTVCWLTIRLLRTRDTRLWLAIGAVVGVGMLAKYLVVLLVIGLVAGLLIAGPRQVLRSRYLLGGLAIGLVIAAPVLLWQGTNGWPQFSMASELSGSFGLDTAIGFVVGQVLMIGLFLTPLWITGLVWLFRRPAYRSFTVAYLVLVVLLIAIGGFGRYTEGLLTVSLAAGCVPAVAWLKSLPRRVLMTVALVANAILAAIMSLPVLPIDAYAADSPLGGLGDAQLGQAGWDRLTDQVADVYLSLPEPDRAHTALLGWNYAEAGALDRFGPASGLPAAYSPHNSYYDFGFPADDKTVVIAVGTDAATLAPHFANCVVAATLKFDLPHLDEDKPVLVCRTPAEPWAALWPKLRWVGTF